MAGTVELQVSDFSAAHQLLQVADRERFEENVPPEKRKKTIGRYFKLTIVAFTPVVALFVWKDPSLTSSLGGCALITFVAGGLATMIGFFAALLDL